MDILKTLFGVSQQNSQADTTSDSPDPDPNDIRALTDPDAWNAYERQGRLKQLEQDIRFEVMRAGPWQPDELEYKRQIRALLREGAIADKGTYWYRSPHSTVYRAQRDGRVTISGWEYTFHAGDNLTFQCRMERDEAREDPGPMLIAQLSPTGKAVLCGEMSSSMRKMSGKDEM